MNARHHGPPKFAIFAPNSENNSPEENQCKFMKNNINITFY
jgi:hypothetical protein